MSSTANQLQTAGAPIGADTTPQEPPRGWVRRVLGSTFARWGARIGLTWVVILAILAVVAPLAASSHPWAIKTVDGQWHSPLLRYMNATDATLFFAAVVAAVLYFCRSWSFGRRALIFVVLVSIAAVVAGVLADPPEPIVYSQYREMRAAGQLEVVINAPVPYSPSDRLRDMGDTAFLPPSADHLLGTDAFGADVASRMVHAARLALAIGFIATGIALVIGVIIGGFMGFFSGIVDLIGMRIVEIMEAVPTLFLLLMFVAFFPGDSPAVLPGVEVNRIYFIMAIIGLTSWSGYARFVRAEFLKLRQQDFVQAGIACGLPLRSILFRHMLPNGVAPVLVSASFGVASAILAEATLSFLGFGLIDEPSWGGMLDQATGTGGAFSWWLATFPGLAIFLTVFAYTLIGEALRDAIDPHAGGPRT